MVTCIDPRRYYICINKYMEVWKRSINKSFAWQFASFQYCQNHEEWDEDLDNNEIEQVLSQYVKTILQNEDLEECFHNSSSMHLTQMENKIEHNIPPMMVVNIEI